MNIDFKSSGQISRKLVGTVRRFGPRGVPYEVIAVTSRDDVLIRVIPTGEETTYPIAHVLADPED
jgi:hypothetical protein